MVARATCPHCPRCQSRRVELAAREGATELAGPLRRALRRGFFKRRARIWFFTGCDHIVFGDVRDSGHRMNSGSFRGSLRSLRVRTVTAGRKGRNSAALPAHKRMG